MTITNVVVTSFRQVVSGRKRRQAEGDIEAEIDIEGESDSTDEAAIKQAVRQNTHELKIKTPAIKVTEVAKEAAESSDVLDGAPTIEEVNSSESKFMASIATILAAVLLFQPQSSCFIALIPLFNKVN